MNSYERASEQLSVRTPTSEREKSLIASAYRVIASQGVHRTTLQDIANEAGVSKGLLVYHFQSKDVVLMTTMQWALERTADRIRARLYETDGGVRQVVHALIDAVFVGPKQNREFYLMYLDLLEHSARAPSFSELAPMTRKVINGLYSEVLRERVSRGEFALDDIEDAADQIRAYIDGIFVTWLQDPDWEHSYERYREMCLSGLLKLLVDE